MKKRILFAGLVVALLIVGITASYVFAAGGSGEESQTIFSQQFTIPINPLEVEIIKWPAYQPGEEILAIYRVKNHSSLIEEVTYELRSNTGSGGIGAVIDYDGPFGSKSPETYNWNKVPIYPGEEQYLYIKFPLPASYSKDFDFNLTVNRNTGARG